jgi:hypothetical protein
MDKLVKLSSSLLLVALLTLLVSCEALFTTNLFGDLDKLDLANMSDREKAVAVLDDTAGAIEGMSSSQVAALISDLNALAADASQTDATRMQAAAASSAVEMSSSGADDTINNLGDLATSLVDGSLVIDSPDDIFTAIFSDSNGNPLSAAQIEVQLQAMVDAAAALEAYGDLLGTSGEAPAGVNSDVLGLTALVAGLVSETGETVGNLASAIADPAGATDTTPADGIPDVFTDLPDMSTFADDPAGTLTTINPGLTNTITGSGMISSLLGMMG